MYMHLHINMLLQLTCADAAETRGFFLPEVKAYRNYLLPFTHRGS